METINTIELRDENTYPDEMVFRSILGSSYEVYPELFELFERHGMNYEWRYYRDGKAWLCKVSFKKRTIVWISAWKGFIQATIYFPLKFLETVLALDISEEIKEKIINTKNVGKSKPCIFEMRSKTLLVDFEKVMKLKIVSK